MEKLHMYQILVVLLTWLSLSHQRPTNEIAGFAPPSPRDSTPIWLGYDYPIGITTADHPYQQQQSEETNPWPPSRKRGFSMLARWKPFNTLSKQRTSIRNINMNRPLMPPAAAANDFELLSAETRAYSRPSGQPLRWG